MQGVRAFHKVQTPTAPHPLAGSQGILKNRCSDLEGKVGKDRLPPRGGQGQETLIRWILDVQVMLAAACGMPITVSGQPFASKCRPSQPSLCFVSHPHSATPIRHAQLTEFGMPRGFGEAEAHMFRDGANAKASNFGAPMSESNDSALLASYNASRDAANASKLKARGSNIF